MGQLIAFKGKSSVKKKYVDRVQGHYDNDEIIKGVYWEKGRGCGVGCTIEGSDHSKYETELGIPRIIARLEDRIFEGLPKGEAKEFPLKFLRAIEPGADLSLVWPKFVVWLLVDPKDGVIKYARPDGKKAIQKVADLYQKVIDGKQVRESTWRAAYAAAAYAADAAADAAAAYAADAAAYADAAYAADAAADADADAAAYYADAAYADAYTAYAAYARPKHYSLMADKLLSLLEETK